MKNKMSVEEFKQYVLSEAKKLYKIELLKEEKEKLEKELSILKESTPPIELGMALMDPETLKRVRQEMLKKAAGWAIPEPKQNLGENKYSDNVTNEAAQVFTGTDVTDPNVKMYFFKIKHDKGTDKLKIADYSQENAKKVIAKYLNAPESAVEFVKEEPIGIKPKNKVSLGL